MRRFWAIRRIDRDYVAPTLYKSEAAARSAAASRRGYDVLELISEAEARGDQAAKADATALLEEAVNGIIAPLARRYDETDYKPGESVCVPTPWAVYARASALMARLPTPPKAEADV